METKSCTPGSALFRTMLYSGIDIANKTFTASALRTIPDYLLNAVTYDNTPAGFRQYYNALQALRATDETILCCMEYTGVYTEHLCHYLHAKKDVLVWVEPAHHVKRAFKLNSKNDRIDSRQISEYARRYEDQFKAWQPPDPVVDKVSTLLTSREMLRRQATAHKNIMKAYKKKFNSVNASFHGDTIDFLNEQEKRIEVELKAALKENPVIYTHAKNLMTIKCVKLYCTCSFLVITRGFTRGLTKKDMMNLAGLLGFAPREGTSGTSVKRREQTDHYGPTMMRKNLHMAARLSCRHVPKYVAYYQRLAAKGKHEQVIYNNVKYKLLKTMCAIIRDGVPYDENHLSIRPDRQK